MTNCFPCSGAGTSNAGAKECNICRAGYYANPDPAKTDGVCLQCAEGKFADVTGHLSCQECPAGRFTAVKKSSTCNACELGTFSSDAGKTTCTRCALGEFAAILATTQCK